jgi:hypothetical protein
MAWRDEIADRAANGDVNGVLKIFGELVADRDRVRQLNAAYLSEIAALKGAPAKPPITVGRPLVMALEAKLKPGINRLSKAIERYEASL